MNSPTEDDVVDDDQQHDQPDQPDQADDWDDGWDGYEEDPAGDMEDGVWDDGDDPLDPMDDSYPPDPESVDDEAGDQGPGHPPMPRSAQVRRKVMAANRPRTRTPNKLGRRQSSRILAQQKRRQALEARKSGATYAQIAEFVGYNDASAARKAVLKAMGDVIQEPATELRSMQIERLNHMLMALWNKVGAGDESAINTALRVLDKIDALMGTEAAREVNVNTKNQSAVLVIDGNKDDYIRSLRQMAGAGIQADGTNVQALPAGPAYPPGMGPQQQREVHEDDPQSVEEPVDAEVVEDVVVPVIGADVPVGPQKNKKKFSFGVDPTVRRK